MFLGQLPLHIPATAGGISNLLEMASYDVGDVRCSPAQAASKQDIMAGRAEAAANARVKPKQER